MTLTGVLATTGTARAGTISYEDSFDLTPTPFEESLTVEQFDSSQGMLQEVTLEFYGELLNDSFIGIENPNDTDATLMVTGDLGLKDFDGNTLSDLELDIEEEIDMGSSDPATIELGGTTFQGIEITRTKDDESTISYLPEDELFDMFVGSGNLEFFADADFATSVAGPGNLLTITNTEAAAGVEVTYDFEETTDVPEPGMLIGSAVLGLGGLFGQRRVRADR